MRRAASTRGGPRRLAAVFLAITLGFLALALIAVLRSGTDPGNTSAAGYLPLAYAATAILVAVVGVAACVRRIDIGLDRRVAWVIGAVSFVVSLVPWWAVWSSHGDVGAAIYRGLRVPQGIIQFWDLSLVLKSIDCSSWGFDVFAQNNGCLADPAIYGPGVLWLQFVPVFSEKYATGLGVLGILVSSLFLVWLARSTTGIGQIVILIAAVGGPWLLLLERGNLDVALLWVAGAVVLLVRRWDRLWIWALAAALIWLLGTWKYYPFAMGLMLIPVLRLRRGWTVLLGFAIATSAFMVITWESFRFSSQSNTNMIDYGDFVVLGRVPVVARMLGTVVGAPGLQAGDLLLYGLVLAAAAWGVAIGLTTRRTLVHPAMLAIAGSAVLLSSVLVAGFGYGYKASFLLLTVPLVAALTRSSSRILVASSVGVLSLTAIASVVVWNTVLATLSALIVAGFAAGLSGVLLLRAVRPAAPARV